MLLTGLISSRDERNNENEPDEYLYRMNTQCCFFFHGSKSFTNVHPPHLAIPHPREREDFSIEQVY